MSHHQNPQQQSPTKDFLRDWFDRLAASGFDGNVFLDAFSDDLVWTATGHSPVSGTFHSKAEYIDKVYRPLDEHLETWPRAEVLRILADGDWAIVEFNGVGGVGTNGTDYSLRYCWVIHVEDSRITEVVGYYDQTKVAELFQ
jgi:ketosteroid isomerase-like protein